MRFSAEQHLAITHDSCRHLLVSATAGAGKTTVMIERIARGLLTGRVRPDELLVMTFSEKAAAQMGERLGERLQKAAADPVTADAARPLLETIPEATVSTIHAFCNRLVSEFSVDLTGDDGQPLLEPGYGVLDPEEGASMLTEAVRSTLDDLYLLASQSARQVLADSGEPVPETLPFVSETTEPFTLAEPVSLADWLNQFLQMASAFAPGYGDDRLEALLLTMIRQLRSLPQYEDWIRKAVACPLTPAAFVEDPAVQAVFAELDRLASPALRDLEAIFDLPYVARTELPKANKTEKALLASLMVARRVLPDLRHALSLKGPERWDAVHEVGRRLLELKLPARSFSGEKGADLEQFYLLFVKHLMPLIHIISGTIASKTALAAYAPEAEYLFARTVEEQVQDEQVVRPLLLRFLETALLADRRYRAHKLRQNRIDFSDFEHYALRLLSLPDVAETVRARYSEMYLDEYQDTSSIQDAVIRKLGIRRDFMVGDVKQSIYRFRYANPGLFTSKAAAYRTVTAADERPEAESDGDLLLLNTNYRSCPAILNAVNDVFSVLMQNPQGEIVYDDSHRLNPGRTDLTDNEAAELILVVMPQDTADEEEPGEQPADTFSALDYEAMEAVGKMRGLLDSGYRPEDIVVLGRSHNICAHYYRILRMTGMPVFGADNEKLFNTFELSLIDSLVSLLVNARQDIPLASVMLSVFAPEPFSEDELLRIRNETDRELMFHDAVPAYRQAGTALAAKVGRFLDRIAGWRRQSHRFSVSELISSILTETGFADYAASLPQASARLSFLTRFLKWLQAADPGDLRTLLAVIAEMRSRGSALKDFQSDNAAGQIRVMTMHAAKGLEFKVVFAAGLAQKFTASTRERLLLSEEQGITTDYFDLKSGRYYRSMRHAHRQQWHADREMQEELRLLYVALTRAEERLIMMAGTNDPEKIRQAVEACFESATEMSFDRQKRVRNPLVLILSALRQNYPRAVDEFFNDEAAAVQAGVVTLRQAGSGQAGYMPFVAVQADDAEPVENTDALIARIAAWLDPAVPNRQLAEAPSKLTVSELKRKLDRQLQADEDTAETPPVDMAFAVDRPDARRRDEAKQLGTALHTVFQFLDLESFRRNPGEADYLDLLQDMTAKAQLDEADAERVKPFYQAVRAFAFSDVADRLTAPGTRVYREMPFTLAKPLPGMPGELTMVQGMIDLWYVTADGNIGLIDYKSDKLTASDPAQLTALYRERYQVQLDYYAEAIEKAMKKKVHWKQIWAIRDGLLLTIT